MRTIEGPMGPFYIPSEPPETSRICEGLTRAVWAGEYDCQELTKEGISTIIDIGAGWGAFAVWALARWPSATIEAYEPHMEAAEYLVRNVPNIVLHHVAVTARPNPLLAINEDWGACSVHHSDPGRAVTPRHPELLPPVDLLKIDAEGVEPEIIESYQRHMGALKVLIYEFHNLEHKARLVELCSGHGLRQVREDQNVTYGTSIWVR